MTDASASVAVVAAFMRQKLSTATDGDIYHFTDRLVEMADNQELVINQRALVFYSLLVFICKTLPQEVCNDIDKVLKSFFGSITVSNVKNVDAIIVSDTEKNRKQLIEGKYERRKGTKSFSNMAAYRAGVEDDEDSCMSCLTTKYRCLRCKEPLCRKCSLPEENDDIPGWKAGNCSSEVGRTGDKQYVSLAPHCWTAGEVAHEIAHALGFYHEQSRPDRDEYVTINWNNIVEAEKVNFAKYGPSRINTLGVPYDYRSLMHLDDKAFSKNGEPTIVPKQAGETVWIVTNTVDSGPHRVTATLILIT
ncbi:Zinc metalloproteinase nas-15 [Stylophora pistillata]|uniref:Metalloendopeptidase n=1 Tax=Stylophora pistillata TaxID=50429 RepID=A0A2B4RB95_STYPI|nr:Zinc metalloproteinase nas-15 [Stylophora pistillata]